MLRRLHCVPIRWNFASLLIFAWSVRLSEWFKTMLYIGWFLHAKKLMSVYRAQKFNKETHKDNWPSVQIHADIIYLEWKLTNGTCKLCHCNHEFIWKFYRIISNQYTTDITCNSYFTYHLTCKYLDYIGRQGYWSSCIDKIFCIHAGIVIKIHLVSEWIIS